MLKTRVVGVLVLKNGWVVQSIGFKKYLPVGSLKIAVEYLNNWGIDEIVVLDIDAHYMGGPNISNISNVSTYSQTPLTVGGGIKSVADIEQLVIAGADKVVVNTSFLLDPSIIEVGARQFGCQCMVVSLDVGNRGEVFNRVVKNSSMSIIEAVKRAQDSGAGEIFLNFVSKDGMKSGYDIETFKMVNEAVDIPVILCGGVGKASHMVEGARVGAQAVAAANFFHFTELSVVSVKQILKRSGVDVRLDSYATFDKAVVDSVTERVTRLEESTLDDMRFEYVPEEVI